MSKKLSIFLSNQPFACLYTPIYLVYPTNQPAAHFSVCLSNQPIFIHPSTFQSVSMSVQPTSQSPTIHLTIYVSVWPTIHQSIHPLICLSNQPITNHHLTIYVSVCPTVHPSIHPMNHSPEKKQESHNQNQRCWGLLTPPTPLVLPF